MEKSLDLFTRCEKCLYAEIVETTVKLRKNPLKKWIGSRIKTRITYNCTSLKGCLFEN